VARVWLCDNAHTNLIALLSYANTGLNVNVDKPSTDLSLHLEFGACLIAALTADTRFQRLSLLHQRVESAEAGLLQ